MPDVYLYAVNIRETSVWYLIYIIHYSDVMMSVIAFEFTSVSFDCSTICSAEN